MKGMNDYRRRDRAVLSNLQKHEARMGELIKQGMSREEASRVAFREMTAKRAAKTRGKFGSTEE